MASELLHWKEDHATGPDGTRYLVQSEQVRGEPREYWAEFKAPGDSDWRIVPAGDASTDRRQAKRNAEAYAQQRAEEPHTDE